MKVESETAESLLCQRALHTASTVPALCVSWKLSSGRTLRATLSSHKAKQNKIITEHSRWVTFWGPERKGFRLLKLTSTLQSLIAFLQPEDILCTPPCSLVWNKLSTYPRTASHRFVCCEQDGSSLTCLQPIWIRALFMLVRIRWGCSVHRVTIHKGTGFMFYSDIETKLFPCL